MRGERDSVERSFGARVGRRSQTDSFSEPTIEVRLIVESALLRDASCQFAPKQHGARVLDADLHQVAMRRDAEVTLERSHDVVLGEPDFACQLVEPEDLRSSDHAKFRAHD